MTKSHYDLRNDKSMIYHMFSQNNKVFMTQEMINHRFINVQSK